MKFSKGFTLIELLIAIFFFSILGTAITTMYIKNTHISTAQTEVVHTQLNLRATADYLGMEIRMAGFNNELPTAESLDPTDSSPKILTATDSQFRFTIHDDKSGTLRDIDIRLRPSQDTDNDGIADDNGADLCIQFGGAGGYQTIAEDIQAVSFAYGYDDDDIDSAVELYTSTGGINEIVWAIPDPAGSGNWMRLDANGDGAINEDDDTDNDNLLNLVNTGTAVNIGKIRAVRVTLLGTSEYKDHDYSNNASYVVGQHVIKPGDKIRRRILTSIVQCRNLRR
ncbi:PilW family protein [uncultured Desulfuromonas sp.]|uniref:PilW family protein n=1 Tax=uncultured Desulfuromonas sp. TaxID=181013 RepID=UPI002AAADB12|nr:PilW family protein [uncultured Desulfuromonas sp.]